MIVIDKKSLNRIVELNLHLTIMNAAAIVLIWLLGLSIKYNRLLNSVKMFNIHFKSYGY
jgi:hypothetical protein